MRRLAGLVLLILLVVAGCAGRGGQTQKPVEKIVIRFSHGVPESHFIARQYQEWADLVEQKSKGAIDVQIYTNAQLYKDPDLIEAVQTGAIEAGGGYHYTLAKSVSSAKIFDLPFLFRSTDDLAKVTASAAGQKIFADIEKIGIKPLGWLHWPVEESAFCFTKEVKVPADAKGLLVRALGPESVAYYKSIGIAPSYITGAELYMGLQRGTIQGAMVTVTTSVERKLYEVAPYTVVMPFAVMESIPIINKSFFEKLPPDLQRAIVEASKEVEAKSLQRAKENTVEVFERAKKAGVKIYVPSGDELALWAKDVDKVWEELVKDKPELQALLGQVRQTLGR